MTTLTNRAAVRRRPRSQSIGSHVPADGDDPPVRGAGQRSLHPRPHARPRASVYRRGGGRRRDLRGAPGRRLHHQHPSRPRALPRQRGVSRPHVRRTARAREAGYCKGKGGSMHIADPDTGNLGANAIVAGSAGIATGAAFSSKHLGNGRVVVCFFGEGALGQGVLYEVMNMAQLWKLPVIYVCENNCTTSTRTFPRPRPATFWPGRQRSVWRPESVDGQDVRAVYAAAAPLVARARQGEGPAFLLCNTYRFRGHHVGRRQPRLLSLQAGGTAVEGRARSDRHPLRLAPRPDTSPTRLCSITSRRK